MVEFRHWRRPMSAFTGLRTSSVMTLLGSLAGLGGAALAMQLADPPDSSESHLAAALAARKDAGHIALSRFGDVENERRVEREGWILALRESAKNRAHELALAAHIEGARVLRQLDETLLAPGGKLDASAARSIAASLSRAGERVIWFDPTLQRDSASSSLPPSVTRAIAARRSTHEELSGAWGFGPALGDGQLPVAFVEVPLPSAPSDALGLAAGALIQLDSLPEYRPLPRLAASWVPMVGMLIGGMLSWLFARHRFSSPLSATLAAARRSMHGEKDARAVVGRGGRDARDIASAVNALIEREEAVRAQGGVAKGEDLEAAVLALEAFGLGNFTTADPAAGMGSSAQPAVVHTIEAARRGVVERVSDLHALSSGVASDAVDIVRAAGMIRVAFGEAHAAVQRSGGSVMQAGKEIDVSATELSGAGEKLRSYAVSERLVLQDLRAALSRTARRAADLRASTARIDDLLASSVSVEESLDLLGRVANCLGEGSADLRARAGRVGGQARAALHSISSAAEHLRGEMSAVERSLDDIASSVPEGGAELAASIPGSAHQAAQSFLRGAEGFVDALRAFERSLRLSSEHVQQVEDSARLVVERLPHLGAALGRFNLGASFESDLFQRLGALREEAETAERDPDGLTRGGRRLLEEVAQGAEAVRGRLTRLVAATDATMEILRR